MDTASRGAPDGSAPLGRREQGAIFELVSMRQASVLANWRASISTMSI